ncbi:TPA: bifunctional NADH-specific enoyl-ACP reductase/trans-2-enoyl-CoA reductase [Candidatus Poribacteria bacterium]|nr:enoyl-[acyl-carrier-protein] reductase FabV [Candidatus Poribacteria bacterium]HCK13748.1 bifunctional NADH-specific enoyl-ACP reductase/trans-2-enoyl-CoA reductase [Candidatus Poribacteria bacterium]
MSLQVIGPKIRGFICTNAHPTGCLKNVQSQIDLAKKDIESTENTPNILVIGASTGYGLASRIALTWGYGANTIGVFFERPPSGNKTGSTGYYNSAAFHQMAAQDKFTAISINGDAFSDQIKQKTIDQIQEHFGQIDLVVYSLASPRRIHPKTGVDHRSVLKPVGDPCTGKTIDLTNENITNITIDPATNEEIADTIAVMGGEDLDFWVELLLSEDLLAPRAKIVAYSYIGPQITDQIYSSGTIGLAKADLEQRINAIDTRLLDQINGRAYLSVNKAVVSQASAAIPIVPLYISILYQIMDAKNLNEKPIDQMIRLFSEYLGPGLVPVVDKNRRIRMDDRELRPDVLAEVNEKWSLVNNDNFHELADFEGYKKSFRNLFGFEVDDVDYGQPVETEVTIPLV